MSSMWLSADFAVLGLQKLAQVAVALASSSASQVLNCSSYPSPRFCPLRANLPAEGVPPGPERDPVGPAARSIWHRGAASNCRTLGRLAPSRRRRNQPQQSPLIPATRPVRRRHILLDVAPQAGVVFARAGAFQNLECIFVVDIAGRNARDGNGRRAAVLSMVAMNVDRGSALPSPLAPATCRLLPARRRSRSECGRNECRASARVRPAASHRRR